ncbi:L-ribulokinase [bacterium A37T11]|nr:L-ribulokinase [bacterium A37T11]
MMIMNKYVIGVDFGTDSVRAVLLNSDNGTELASSISYYPRWKKGLYTNPSANLFRQHPLDYLEGLEQTVRHCVQQVGPEVAGQVVGLSVDTTGSTPVAVDAQGTPLALLPEFAENLNAMFVLWKDHTSIKEAAEINKHAAKFNTNYLDYVGGIYSSEWYWAKLLHVLRADTAVREAVHTWVEHCDWIPFLLTGGNKASDIRRGVCSAGHKSLWSEAFGGFPPNEFFASLDPLLDGFVHTLPKETYTAAQAAGTLSEAWAKKLGLPSSVVIGIGAFDCHMGAVGGQIEPYYLSKIIGTSTCDILVAPREEMKGKLVRGICGQVNGSVIPDMVGLEAGQSAFGDVYAWFKNILLWPIKNLSQASDPALEDAILPELNRLAALIPITATTELAVDWFNGRRTPDANQLLKGAITGLNLASDPPRIFRALAEATAFGAKKIVDRFIDQDIPVKGLIVLGGIPRKSPFIMQLMADVINMPIRVHRSEQTCAMGAAMFAATAAGVFDHVEEAMQHMGQGFDQEYTPNAEKVAIYAERYEAYTAAGSFLEAQLEEKFNPSYL